MIYIISTCLLLSTISSRSTADTSSASQLCSRENSRKIRSFIDKEIISRLDIAKLSDKCILHPSFDMLAQQEQNKDMLTRREWKCNYCGKRFVDEFYLDRHMDNKHESELPPNATVCLADLCPMFGCNSNSSNRGKIEGNRDYYGNQFTTMAKCTDSEVEKSRYKCELIARRCFSDDSTTYSTEDFTRQVCDRLKCVGGLLKGAATDLATRTAFEENDNGDLRVLFVVIKVLICFVLIAALLVNYSPALGLRILAAIGLANGTARKADYTARLGQGRKQSGWWKYARSLSRTVSGSSRDKQN